MYTEGQIENERAIDVVTTGRISDAAGFRSNSGRGRVSAEFRMRPGSGCSDAAAFSVFWHLALALFHLAASPHCPLILFWIAWFCITPPQNDAWKESYWMQSASSPQKYNAQWYTTFGKADLPCIYAESVPQGFHVAIFVFVFGGHAPVSSTIWFPRMLRTHASTKTTLLSMALRSFHYVCVNKCLALTFTSHLFGALPPLHFLCIVDKCLKDCLRAAPSPCRALSGRPHLHTSFVLMLFKSPSYKNLPCWHKVKNSCIELQK